MNIAIVEDSHIERELLSNIVTQYALTHQLDFKLDLYESAEALLEDYRPHRYGLIFLDIYMRGLSGMEAAEEIRKGGNDTLLIFLTSSNVHMPAAFRVHAYDYLLKPIDVRYVFRVLDELLGQKTGESQSIRFTSERREYVILFDDICSVRASDHYLEIDTTDGESYRPRMTFASVQEQLSADPRFLLILRGVLVNMDHIKDFSDGSCEMTNGLTLPVNLRKARSLELTWKNYLFQKQKGSARHLDK